ncbi:hypothetical protein HQN90_23765 [Paenibacillus alba]|nr:hypothetical protein [Paenibacillus alba]
MTTNNSSYLAVDVLQPAIQKQISHHANSFEKIMPACTDIRLKPGLFPQQVTFAVEIVLFAW